MASKSSSVSPPDLCCSFCNKSQRAVKTLIAGPTVYICNECVDICLNILSEARKDAAREPEQPSGNPPGIGYAGTPQLGVVVSCSLCHMSMPSEHGLAVHNRGLLCPGCIGAIEAAIASERESEERE